MLRNQKVIFHTNGLTGYKKLNYKVQDLTKTDFYLSLKNSVISQVDFNKLIKHCKKII